MQNLEAGAAIGAGQGKDSFGHVETRGIDMIPDVERKSRPRELFSVFFGPQFGFGNMLFGALAIAFGLGWWASFAAITIGSVAGSLIFIAIAPISPKTGTNSQVSSGGAFGVKGRLLGSGITWFIAMGFFVILVYTSAQALIYTFARWFGTPTGLGALSVAMAVIIAVTCVAAILGHRTLAGSLRVITILSVIVGLLVLAAFAGKFHAVHGGHSRVALPAGQLLADLVHRHDDHGVAADLLGPVRRRLRPLHPVQFIAQGRHRVGVPGYLRRLLGGDDRRRVRGDRVRPGRL
jgi:purine-cytosine permease-like protein